jgi:hypothetical protein
VTALDLLVAMQRMVDRKRALAREPGMHPDVARTYAIGADAIEGEVNAALEAMSHAQRQRFNDAVSAGRRAA